MWKKKVGIFIKKKSEWLKGVNSREKKGNKGATEKKINQDLSGNKKFFLKEVGKVNVRRLENCSQIKDKMGKFSMEQM